MSDVSPEQKPYDRPVTNTEVAGMAKKRCQWCNGTGFRRNVVSDRGSGSVSRGQTVVRAELCGCARNRFVKTHHANITTFNGLSYWLPGKGPEVPK